jgi:hypothetical protein
MLYCIISFGSADAAAVGAGAALLLVVVVLGIILLLTRDRGPRDGPG